MSATGSESLDRLRERYRDAAVTETFDLPIGRVAAGSLVAVYKEPEWVDVQEISSRWAGTSGEERTWLYAQAELLAKACVDILLRDDDHPDAQEREGLPGKYLPGLGLGRGPVTFDAAASELGIATDKDDPLLAVFGVLASDWEVERHGKAVGTWEPTSSSAVREVDADGA